MMTYENDELTTLDIDWFAVDAVGRIAHFATAGTGFVPEKSKSEHQVSDAAFDVLFEGKEFTQAVIIEENLPNFETVDQKKRYLCTFESMAKRGYFSFDVAGFGADNSSYVLVARPAEPALIKMTDLNDEQSSAVPKFEHGVFDNYRLKVSHEDWCGRS